MSFSNIVHVKDGVHWYDFGLVESREMCEKIELTCGDREKWEKVRTIAYIVGAFAVSLILRFSFINTLALEAISFYFFSSEAIRRSEHYGNMREQAGLRLIELTERSSKATHTPHEYHAMSN